jgi:hypothetical protein
VSTAPSAGALRSAFPSLAPKSVFNGLTPYDRFSADGSNGEGLIEIYEVP